MYETIPNRVIDQIPYTIDSIDLIESGVNTTAKLTTVSGDQYFMKLSTFTDSAVFKAEMDIHNQLHQRGFPTTEIIYQSNTTDHPVSNPFFITPFLSYDEADIREISTEQVTQLGTFAGRLASIGTLGYADTFGRLVKQNSTLMSEGLYTTFEEAYIHECYNIVEQLLTIGRSKLPISTETLGVTFQKFKESVYNTTEYESSLCHTDLRARNILWNTTNGDLLIDWGNISIYPWPILQVTTEFLASHMITDSEKRFQYRQLVRNGFESEYNRSVDESDPIYNAVILSCLIWKLRGVNLWYADKSDYKTTQILRVVEDLRLVLDDV